MQLVFALEIPSGAFKNLVHVIINVCRSAAVDQSEETCMGSTSAQEALRASRFTSDDNGFGSKSGEQKIETKICS